MSPPESSSQKKILYAVLTAFVALFFVAAAGEFVLRQQRVAIEDSEKLEKGLFAYDSRLGWRLQGNWGGKHRHHDFAVAYQTGPDGFRGRFRPASDRTGPEHIAFFGDSFTFGFGAGPGQTFVALLDEADVYRAYLNFGVPGFASDQAVLLIEEIMPDVPYTLSHRIAPILREYRRASATAIDASLKPLMQAHLRGMQTDLRDIGFTGDLLVSTSVGGCQEVETLVERPINTLKSGPAMAPVAGRAYSALERMGGDVFV